MYVTVSHFDYKMYICIFMECENRPIKISPKLLVLPKLGPSLHREGGRVLGEVERVAFIALPGKGSHNGFLPSRLCDPL